MSFNRATEITTGIRRWSSSHKYLKSMFNFMGVKNYQIIRAQGNALPDCDVLAKAFHEAEAAAASFARDSGWVYKTASHHECDGRPLIRNWADPVTHGHIASLGFMQFRLPGFRADLDPQAVDRSSERMMCSLTLYRIYPNRQITAARDVAHFLLCNGRRR